MSDPAELAQELDDIRRQYEAHFAGQSRATRSLALMDRLIGRLGDVLARLELLPQDDPALAAMGRSAEEIRGVYQREREAIAAAQEAGPDFDEAADLASLANLVFGRYHRHFAGQPRSTRDLGLLREMITDLRAVQGGMARLKERGREGLVGDDLALVERTLAMYEGELREIERAQTEGSLEEQASILASLANGQLQLYRVHFAGRARIGRRPQLLARIIGRLREIESRMAALEAAGLRAEFNAKNLQIVRQSRARYEEELEAVRAARQEAALDDLLGHLGEEANEIFDEYAAGFGGKDRAQVDLGKLGELCDRLGEIARQMRDLLRAAPSEIGRQNLDVVLGHLGTFEQEWEQVQRRQAEAAQKIG